MRQRIRQWLPLLGLTGVLLFTPSARAQECTNGFDWDNTPPPEDIIPFDWSRDFVALTRLVSHHMPAYGDGDSMTEPFAFRSGQMGTHPFGSDGPRETWYVSRDNIASLGWPWTGSIPAAGHAADHALPQPDEHGPPHLAARRDAERLRARPEVGLRVGCAAIRVPAVRHPPALVRSQRRGVRGGKHHRQQVENASWKVEFNPVWGNAIGRTY
jgi:hypothetical protein